MEDAFVCGPLIYRAIVVKVGDLVKLGVDLSLLAGYDRLVQGVTDDRIRIR